MPSTVTGTTGSIGPTGASNSTATGVVLSNAATGTTNYVILSLNTSGPSQLLTDTSGLSYNSVTNTLAANITGTSSNPTPFVPIFNNSSWFQNTTSTGAYSELCKITFTGTWNVNDFIVFRVNALQFWGGAYNTSTWTSFGRAAGTLQIRPEGMPGGVWSNTLTPTLNWANNTGTYAGIGDSQVSFFWADNTAGTLTGFNVYGASKSYAFLFKNQSAAPFYAGMSLEYIYSYSSGGGTHSVTTSNTYTTGFNNALPN